MLTLFFKFFQKIEHYGHTSTSRGSFSKAPNGFSFWTFINVQNEKPKVEYGKYLLL